PASAMPVPAGEFVLVDVIVTSALDQPQPQTATLAGGFVYVDSTEAFFLTRVSPDSGSSTGGDSVTIFGGGFREPLQVDFGGRLAADPLVQAGGSEISVTVPASAQPVPAGGSLLVDVKVTNALNQREPQVATLAGGFTYVDPTGAFFLTRVSPNTGSAAGGNLVTIFGGGFREPLRVDFGDRQAADPVVNAAGTEIAVVVPASSQPVPAGGTLPVDDKVTNALDQSGTRVETLAGGYSYVSDPPPQIFSLTPSSGPNQGGTIVTIGGANFEDPTVFFGGVEATRVNAISASRLEATTPAAGSANQNRSVDVVVRNRSNGLEGVQPAGFTYGSPILITSLSPARGPFEGGTKVAVTGQGFPLTGSVAVELAGILQSSEVVTSATQLSFETVGVALGTCPASGELPQVGITVTDLATGNSGSAGLTFAYTVPRPTIRRLVPTAGPQTGGTAVTIEAASGGEFSDPVRVVFAKGSEEFAATVISGTATTLSVASPRVPDTLFAETDCVVGGASGKRYLPTTVDVRVTNTATGCEDTFGNGFTYSPSNGSCRQVTP
ncbi:MAG: IPT/TIG domain-containing protein, partial [Acidobacteria bacterium]|nr:IPT/TIG domain-containing protein [Acidobacteriota bacterium]